MEYLERIDRSNKKDYLKNRDLYEEIMRCKEDGVLSKTAVKMLMLLTTRVTSRMKYRDPEDRKDCMSFAHVDLLLYWKGFDASKSTNAFAYYTEMIKKGLAKGWNHCHPKKYGGTISYNGSSTNPESEGIYTIS